MSTASEYDTLHFEEVLDPVNTNILGDKGYVDGGREARLSKQGWRMQRQRKGHKDKPISVTPEWRNKRITKTSARVEHVFAGLAQLGGKPCAASACRAPRCCSIGKLRPKICGA